MPVLGLVTKLLDLGASFTKSCIKFCFDINSGGRVVSGEITPLAER